MRYSCEHINCKYNAKYTIIEWTDEKILNVCGIHRNMLIDKGWSLLRRDFIRCQNYYPYEGHEDGCNNIDDFTEFVEMNFKVDMFNIKNESDDDRNLIEGFVCNKCNNYGEWFTPLHHRWHYEKN